VALRVTTPDLTLSADVRLPDPDSPPADPHGSVITALAGAGLLVLGLLVTWTLLHRARRRRRPPPIVIAHGRAAVPTVDHGPNQR
jgi:hypothetical protein